MFVYPEVSAPAPLANLRNMMMITFEAKTDLFFAFGGWVYPVENFIDRSF